MLYVIGLAHRAQARTRGLPETEAQRKFAECLREIVAQARVAFIAEEYNEEALVQ